MSTRFLGLFVTVIAGCTSARTGESMPPANDAMNQTVIHTSNNEFKGGSGLTASVKSGSARYELAINGRSTAGEVWTIVAELDAETVQNGNGSAPVQGDPSAAGFVDLKLQSSPTSFVQGSAGELSFEFQKGRIIGEVAGAEPSNLDATFDGVLAVTCLVPSKSQAEGGGTVADDGSTDGVMVADPQLSDPACAALLPWAQ